MMDSPNLQIITPEEFSDQWESFSVVDTALSGHEWGECYEELVRRLSADFLYTGLESAPADFFVGHDWFQTRVQCVIFFSWHFLCRRMLESCREFVTAHAGWGVSIVCDGCEMDYEGPGIEMMLSRDHIKMSAEN